MNPVLKSPALNLSKEAICLPHECFRSIANNLSNRDPYCW
jgi:hypothetical protein